MKIRSRLRQGKIFFWLDIVLIIGVVCLAFAHRPSLQDFEQRCRETPDPKEKEKIALDAVKFLVSQDVPDSIVNQVNQEVAKEDPSLPADTLLFPEIPAAMDDSLAGLYEARLADNLPRLYWMRRNKPESVRSENFVAARKIAAQLDAWAKYNYWAPLMEFLEKADAEVWKRWRAAARAANISKDATRDSKFEFAKQMAVYGLQCIRRISDHRLFLDLCLRLQNAIAEGDAMFNLGFALGDWITKESLVASHYLRAVAMEFNICNQLIVTRRLDEALERLQPVLRMTQRWRHVRNMDWYERECFERISAALYEMGDYRSMLYYLNLSDKPATSARQKALFAINQGLAARYLGDLQTAEKEFQKAIALGKGDERNGITSDPLNVYYAYLNLGFLFLEYNLPEKALSYFDELKVYAENIEGFLNAGRLCEYWLHRAQACIQKNDITSAKMALDKTIQFIKSVDSPYLQVKNLFALADVYEKLSEFAEARDLVTKARQICSDNGFVYQEINAILRQAALDRRVQDTIARSAYPAQELERVITKIQNSGNKWQLINALSLIIDAETKTEQYISASRYASLLLAETERLSQFYDQEQRLIFFQHSIYKSIKFAIKLDIHLGEIDSAFIKLDYVKARALRCKLSSSPISQESASGLQYADRNTLQKHLQSDEAIIDYMVTEDTLYTFVLTPFALRIFRTAIPKHELQALVDEYLNLLTADDRSKQDYDEQHFKDEFYKTVELSHALYNKLLSGAAELLKKSKRLYIVPDEFLHALPFSTLVMHEDIEPDFLVTSKATMYLPSASMLFNFKATDNNLDPKHYYFWASIDPAMFGADEIKNHLTKLLKPKVWLQTQWESKTSLLSSLAGGHQMYLFYAHSKADWDDPWQSYIEFPLDKSNQSGKLTYEDIGRIDWQQAQLVILAGCQTMGSRIYSGAGLSGLQRSFLTGGAKQVLATFWRVDAAQVVSQMSDFLMNWNRHGDTMLALQSMQRAALAKLKADPYLKYPHPRFWGAYNLTGATHFSSLNIL